MIPSPLVHPAKDVFLLPGEYFVGASGYKIKTILGSCVAITLWHPRLRVGAMCHFLLPTRGIVSGAGTALDGRYANEALQLMLHNLQAFGVQSQECVAKVFGGGQMFPGSTRFDFNHIGQRNGEAARALLAQYAIPLVSENLFGVGHRQIIFDIAQGDVWARQVEPSMLDLTTQVETLIGWA